MAKTRKRRPRDLLRLKWSPEYQEQELRDQLHKLQEESQWWEQEVARRKEAVRLARRRLRQTLRGVRDIEELIRIGWPLFDPPPNHQEK